MIIEDKRASSLNLYDVDDGTVFEVRFDGGQSFFMKTDDEYDSGNIKCVNLQTGEMCEFKGEAKVIPLGVKLVIE